MTKRQKARANAKYRGKTLLLLPENNALLILIVLYPALKARLLANFAKLEAAMQKQITNIQSVTASKAEKKADMAHIIWIYAQRASVQAESLGNTTLFIALSELESFISIADDTLALERAKKLLSLMTNEDLTILEPENLVEMQDAITLFSDDKEAPELAIDEKKSEGTEKIDEILDDLDTDTKLIGSLIHSFSLPFADLWDQALKVGASEGVRHVSCMMKFNDSITATPVVKVKTTASNGIEEITAYSSKNGTTRFIGLDTGNWTFHSEAETYISDYKANVPIDDDHTVHFQIKLVKIQPPPPSEEDTPPVTSPPPTDENPSQLNT